MERVLTNRTTICDPHVQISDIVFSGKFVYRPVQVLSFSYIIRYPYLNAKLSA